MSAVVSGVVEETAFPEVAIVLTPFYLAIAAVYGLIAAATNSTCPSMVPHAGRNLLSAFSLFSSGRSEWQLTTSQAPAVWQTGVDAAFVLNVLALFGVGTATMFAYRCLFKAAAALAARVPGCVAGSRLTGAPHA